MLLTFQTALYFTMIGLSFAASSGRHVRWCTMSDPEQKKCRDLMESYKVPDINLSCVQRPSTENCMAAIRDREVDAMFLDSADIDKASVNPYNLKPIIAEPYRYFEGLTKCLKERQIALVIKLIGGFVPQCDEKGNYQPQQCHGSTGYCWCVNPNGEMIDGTNTPPGQNPPTCEGNGLTKCLKERQIALEIILMGGFVPQCDKNGNYQPLQCHGSTGECWCVEPNGEIIDGTITPRGQTSPNCGGNDLTKCLKERQIAIEVKLIGGFVPRCDEKGNYQPQQCHGSTGYCWCVNPNGEMIDGTNTPPGQNPPTCEGNDLTKCLKERQIALQIKLIGGFVPRCDEKGNYHPQQCHASTGYCWCINPNGEMIDGTNTPPGQTPPKCERQGFVLI